jgi:hypothetical protein
MLKMSAPADKITIFGAVTIHAVASDEVDPYGQPGFSSVTADIVVSDKESASALKKSWNSKSIISVRCGGLELQGIVSRYSGGLAGAEAKLAVRSLLMLPAT